MSRIKFNEKEILKCPELFYEEFHNLTETIFNCGNDKLQIECNLKIMPTKLIEYIKNLHLTDENKSLELIDNINGINIFYNYCDQKDQSIAEQTAVKEFANEMIKMLNKYSIKGTIKICDNVIENNINLILKRTNYRAIKLTL